ncbi:MAG: FKBP-type peptidyl-prolyl cis-trans isomerase [Cyclobacteriaceae bacterium]
MNIRTALSFTFAAAIFVSACSTNNEKTARNGLTYTVVEEGEGESSQSGEYMVLNMRYINKNTDSVWYDTSDEMPQLIQNNDSIWMAGEKMLQVIFGEMKEGDSVVFDVTAGDLFGNTWKQPLPPGVEAEQVIQFEVGLDQVLTQDELMAWMQEQDEKRRAVMEEQAQEQYAKDVEILEQYFADNNIETAQTESGVYIEMLEEGNGTEANPGDSVSVNYTGYLLNGTFFDTSNEELARENNLYQEGRPYEPFSFVLGQGAVIKGWDEGLAELQEGDKARFYIPSTLAYGPQQRGNVIGPNSILVFDIELVEVN